MFYKVLQEQKLAVSVALGILLITFLFLNYAQPFQEFCHSLNSHQLEQTRSNHLESKELWDFQKNILKRIRRKPNSFYDCDNYKGIRFNSQVPLMLSHFREHKFQHNISPFSACCPLKDHTYLNKHASLLKYV